MAGVQNEEYLKEDSFKYGVAFNGKVRFDIEFPADVTAKEAFLLLLLQWKKQCLNMNFSQNGWKENPKKVVFKRWLT